MNGFILNECHYRDAAAWVNCENQMVYNDEHSDYAEWELEDYEDDYEVDYSDADSEAHYFQSYTHRHHYPSFRLTKSGRGFLITVNTPAECDFYGEPILFLTEDTKKGPAASWDESKKGWLVNRRDHEAALEFVNGYH
jgi:hypothetical protein